MRRYVVGFAFNHDKTVVTLMQKNRPDWQKGQLNGIGGAVEGYEGARVAMAREFEEEAGVATPHTRWVLYHTLKSHDFMCDILTAVLTRSEFEAVTTRTDEEVLKMPLSQVDEWPMVSNVPWLIPMALDKLSNPKLDCGETHYIDPD